MVSGLSFFTATGDSLPYGGARRYRLGNATPYSGRARSGGEVDDADAPLAADGGARALRLRPSGPNGYTEKMSYASSDTWLVEQEELRAAEARAAAFRAAEQDAERISREFTASRPPDSPAYGAEWTTRTGSSGSLIFVFSVVLDLEEDFDPREYPGDAADCATEELRRRLFGSSVGEWGVYVVSVTARPRSSSGD